MKKKPPILTHSPPQSPSSFPPFLSHYDAVLHPAMVPTLPADLINNILSKLPVKPLGKFKSVTKQWLQLITDPYFISTHRELCLQTPNILLLKKTPVLQEPHMKKCTRVDACSLNLDGSRKNLEFSLYLNHDVTTIEMLPSKWDLICFVSDACFYACNPSKPEFLKLPQASWCTSGETNAGMGYIKERDEYVLVHLFDRSMDINVDYDVGCEVLRLKDGKNDYEWKVVDANCPFVVRGWGVYVENIFYWMIWEYYTQPGDDAIVSFNLETEEIRTVSPPEGCFDPHGMWSLVELGGNLCLLDNMESPQQIIDVWVMKDSVNHKWVREYSIDMTGYTVSLSNYIIPLDYRNGKIWLDAKHESRALDFYDVEEKRIKRMEHMIAGEWTWLRIYNESFFSLVGKTRLDM